MQTTVRRRPLGITILAIILAIFGILSLLLIVLALISIFALSSSKVIDGAAVVASVVVAVIAIVEIAVAWGFWTLKPWAFWTAVVVEAIRVVEGLYALLVQHNNGGIISLIIPAIILIYLFADRNVRAAFRT